MYVCLNTEKNSNFPNRGGGDGSCVLYMESVRGSSNGRGAHVCLFMYEEKRSSVPPRGRKEMHEYVWIWESVRSSHERVWRGHMFVSGYENRSRLLP